MATNRLRKALNHLQSVLAPPGSEALTDAQLLARFLAGRDEAAFAVLVRRHGPMVLGVCRRLLRHAQDAEDAFQAAFLVLARKAGSVLKGEAVGSWLYMVAYRAAQRARAGRARRQAREKQVDDMPHPPVQPEETQDWLPLLDDELGRLPEKYRAPVVLCDLEGQSRREAARQLKVPDGTLSRRLAAGRRLLAERLSRRGVTLSGGALAAALSGGAASAQVAAPLVVATAKAAVFAAQGHLAAVSTPVAVLTKGVLRGMFLTKLKVVLGVVLVVAALGAGGVAYRTADAQTVQTPRRAEGKPRSELEALRRENELLRLNLEVVLEKVRAQEAELRALRGRPVEGAGDANKLKPGRITDPSNIKPGYGTPLYENRLPGDKVRPDEQLHRIYPKPKEPRLPGDVADRIEVALKRLLDAKGSAAQQRALEELREALHTLRAQPRHSPYYPQQNSVPRTK
jgi:RNA polymerase sigma factor (sigma-70 family)